MSPLLRRIGIDLPIVQAPMAGVSTPEMAAAVSNAGGLGAIGVGRVRGSGPGRAPPWPARCRRPNWSRDWGARWRMHYGSWRELCNVSWCPLALYAAGAARVR